LKIEAPIADCPIILNPQAEYQHNEQTTLRISEKKQELHYLRGEVIAYGYDIESKVRDLISFLFATEEEPKQGLSRHYIGSILLSKLDFSKKIVALQQSLEALEEECEDLIKELNFIRKRRNRFAHELVCLIPINKGIDGFIPVFMKDDKETIINQQFVDEFLTRCQSAVNQMTIIQRKFTANKSSQGTQQSCAPA
jgi:hypothetical protein